MPVEPKHLDELDVGPEQTISRLIYVDRERYLPVRAVQAIEGLPRTPENERLLSMSPHPGAKEVDAR